MRWTQADSIIFLPNLLLVLIVALIMTTLNAAYFHFYETGAIRKKILNQIGDGSESAAEFYADKVDPPIALNSLKTYIDQLGMFIETTQKRATEIDNAYRIIPATYIAFCEMAIFGVLIFGALMTIRAIVATKKSQAT